MIWSLNGKTVLTIYRELGILDSDPRFNATNLTINDNYKWQLTIYNVTRNDSGEIKCEVQNVQITTARLFVQGEFTIFKK